MYVKIGHSQSSSVINVNHDSLITIGNRGVIGEHQWLSRSRAKSFTFNVDATVTKSNHHRYLRCSINTPPPPAFLHNMTLSKGCFPLGGIFRAQRNFSLFVSSQAELIEKRQRKIALRAENSAQWKTALSLEVVFFRKGGYD